MSFFMSLPSDSSRRYFPDNKVSHFITQLPIPISLRGEWEVGLAEIIYPHTWYNVHQGQNLFGFDTGDGQLIGRHVPPACYESIPDLLKAMTLAEHENKIEFSYNKVTKRVTIKTEENARVILNEGIGDLLGFDSVKIGGSAENSVQSPYIADPNALFSVMYVYSDIVEPQIVGDIQAPLLRIVKVKGNDGEVISSHYDRPHYMPVIRNNFQTIEIEIRLNSGSLVPFERGKVIVILHFRMRQII